MKVTVDGKEIRIHGSRGVDLRIHASEENDCDRFMLSLCYDGFEHGSLPMIEVSGGHIVVHNNSLERGKQLLK